MQNTIQLNDSYNIPAVGYGVFLIPDNEVEQCVLNALEAGYRHLDTAKVYRNEEGVGRAVKASGIPRDEIFVTTKLWNTDQGYDTALAACQQSLDKLKLDYLNLYLVHWPAPARNKFVESWKALIELQERGLTRSIGVSNFTIEHLQRIIEETEVVPVINQIELHPYFQQTELRAYHTQQGIVTQSWGPLAQGSVPSDQLLHSLANKYNKTIAQIILRWHLDIGCNPLPKSSQIQRMRENLDVFDFSLTSEEIQQISKLDKKEGRIGPNPLTADWG